MSCSTPYWHGQRSALDGTVAVDLSAVWAVVSASAEPVDPTDPDELADALTTLLEDDATDVIASLAPAQDAPADLTKALADARTLSAGVGDVRDYVASRQGEDWPEYAGVAASTPAGLADYLETIPRSGDRRVWIGADSQSGLDDIRTRVEAIGGFLDDDMFVLGDEGDISHDFARLVDYGAHGQHVVPIAVGDYGRMWLLPYVGGDPTANVSGCPAGVDPVAAGIAGWSHSGQLGSPSYSANAGAGTLTMTASASGQRAAYLTTRIPVGEAYLVVAEKILASGKVDLTLFGGDDSGEYIEIRAGATEWEIRTGASTWTSMGQSISVAATLELLFLPVDNLVIYRWGRGGGTWQSVTPNLATLAPAARTWREYATYDQGTASYTRGRLLVVPVKQRSV